MRYVHDKTKSKDRLFPEGTGKHYAKKPNRHGKTQMHLPVNLRDIYGVMILPKNKFAHN